MSMKDLINDLEKRRAKIKKMGGEERVAKQHERGKLTARERVELLFDKGTFLETGIHATQQKALDQNLKRETPADGVITGFGQVDGRDVFVAAYDFTVLAGSIGQVGELKVGRIRDLALKHRKPIVWLIDSAGARIQEGAGSQFAGTGYLFREQVIMSGVVPQVAAMVGPGAAGTAYIPGLADFVPMVKGTSSMALGGPPLVKAVVGEEISEQDLGGSKVHTKESGVADVEVKDDEECIKLVRDYLSYFPSNCDEKPPIVESSDDPHRRDDKLLEIVPDSPRKPYDIRKLIELIVDNGRMLEIKPKFARNIITALSRMGGMSVGIIANQPKYLAGALDNNSADKAAHFIMLCDAFNIPLLFIQDVPGFLVGSKVEKEGIIRHGAKMLYAVSEATVPKITVVVRKAYGAGYYVMCGRAYEPDLIVAWPSAEISLMGPEGAVNIIFRKQIAASDDPDKTRKDLIKQFSSFINPYLAAEAGLIDDIIDPRDTRSVVIRALKLSWNKVVERPRKKHGIMPV